MAVHRVGHPVRGRWHLWRLLLLLRRNNNACTLPRGRRLLLLLLTGKDVIL